MFARGDDKALQFWHHRIDWQELYVVDRISTRREPPHFGALSSASPLEMVLCREEW
jgi:hypothetical protein